MNKKIIHYGLFCLILGLGLSFGHLSAQTKKHYVEKSETVYGIAKKYNTTEGEILRLNPELSKRSLRSGEFINIPQNKSITQTPPRQQVLRHRIKQGETLTSIAKYYGVTIESILKLNPEIDRDHYKANFILLIPDTGKVKNADKVTDSDTDKNATNQEIFITSDPYPAISNRLNQHDTVRVSIALPLKNGSSDRYLHFLEGFLMGLNDLKKQNISVVLHTYHIDGVADTKHLINSGALYGEHLLIGGSNDNEIDLLADFCKEKNINYVVPFSSKINDEAAYSTLFKINPLQQTLYPYIAKEFIKRYGNNTIYFVSNRFPDDPLISYLQQALTDANISYRIRDIKTLDNSINNAVVMPCNAKSTTLTELFDRLDAQEISCKVFGYPAWQSFTSNLQKRMPKYNTTFYSSFYFPLGTKDANIFLNKFYAWYNHKVTDTYPKYSVLGYDIAKYFIYAIHNGGIYFYKDRAELVSNGLQSDFRFVQPDGTKIHVNANVFFVTPKADRPALRETIVNAK